MEGEQHGHGGVVQILRQQSKLAIGIAPPAPDNRRAVRAYEKAGFVIDRPIETEEGPALLMVFEG